MKNLTLLIALITFLMSATAQNIPSYVPTDNLIGYWGFDGDADDYSGNGNNGNVNGAKLTEDRHGNANSAYLFDGVRDVISFYPNDSSIISQSSDFTWSLWFSSPTNDFNGTFLNVGSWFCKLGHDSPGLFFKDELGNQTNTWYVQQHFNYLPDVNTWHNLVIMKTGNNVTLLIDNVTIGSMQTWGFSNFNNSNLVQFGYYCCNEFFNGKLDDIGIWNRALSESEIKAIYSENVCTDTIQVMVYDTTYVTINDTIIYYDSVSVAVTDTLIINTEILGLSSPNNTNTLKVYPNPANDVVIIDNGNFSSMSDYKLKIVSSLGAEVFNSFVSIPQFQIPVSSLGNSGLYYIQIFDENNILISTKKLILK